LLATFLYAYSKVRTYCLHRFYENVVPLNYLGIVVNYISDSY